MKITSIENSFSVMISDLSITSIAFETVDDMYVVSIYDAKNYIEDMKHYFYGKVLGTYFTVGSG